ncbi:hypothetical protein EV363DRAFT_1428926 [Boletus edulis]|nr:hypothetical protein EV363DRAFT_1428926 [Boletus edulis]
MDPATVSSETEFALTALQQCNYATLAILTAVGYDYVLTFQDEVQYIWSKRWTRVSTLFIFVRYIGLFHLVTCSILGSSFLSGPQQVREIMYAIDAWTYDIFLGAADFVMMLRVWAMYNRSRLILTILLTLFFFEIIPSIIFAAINSDLKNLSAPHVQILNFSHCIVLAKPVWTKETAGFQITHGAALCILAIFRFVGELLRMHSATKQWQINQYMKLLAKEGVLYFFVIFLFNLMGMLTTSGKFPKEGLGMILSFILEYVPIFALTPRFILSIRRMYARDVEGRCGEEIDTGFGLSSSGHGATIVFADIERNGGLEDIEEIETTQAV